MDKTLLRMEESAEAVVLGCSVKKDVLKKILPNSPDTCAEVSSKWRFRHWGLQLY